GGCSLQVLEVLFEPGVWPMGQIGPVAAFLVELVGGVEIGGVASGVDRLDPAIASFHGAAGWAWARRPIWQRKPDRLPQLIEMFGHSPLLLIYPGEFASSLSSCARGAVPAEAGTHPSAARAIARWTPPFAGEAFEVVCRRDRLVSFFLPKRSNLD